jgi:hypothetical protein
MAALSTAWDSLAGDPARFAVRIAFQTDPDEGQGQDADLLASWGSLQIWAGGSNLTEYASGGETADRIHWYLLPFLEWLTERWDPLLHEERLPVKIAGQSAALSLDQTAFPPEHLGEEAAVHWERAWHLWWRRHALQSCREGGLFPNVMLRRYRDQIEVSWKPAPTAGIPEDVSFLARAGHHRLPVAQVASPLWETLRQAASYLYEQRPRSARLRLLGQRIEKLRSPLLGAQRLAWLAGIGTTPLEVLNGFLRVQKQAGNEREKARFFSAPQEGDLYVPGACHASLLIGSVAPDIQGPDVLALCDALAAAGEPGFADRLSSRAEGLVPDPASPPFQQGGDLAKQFLERMKLSGGSSADMDDLLGRLDVRIGEVRLSDASIPAVSLAGPDLHPTVLLNAAFFQDPLRRRSTLAHQLCHLLFDRDRGERWAMACGPFAPLDMEQRADGFAAAAISVYHE